MMFNIFSVRLSQFFGLKVHDQGRKVKGLKEIKREKKKISSVNDSLSGGFRIEKVLEDPSNRSRSVLLGHKLPHGFNFKALIR